MAIQLIPSQFKGENKEGDFNWMIKNKEYTDALFIFNDNEEAFLNNSKEIGKGNAIIRPYKYTNPVRSAGIPTGNRTFYRSKGYSKLTAHNKDVIEQALNIIKKLLDTGRYKRVYYSANVDGSLGTSIFTVNEDVKQYIVKRLKDIVMNY